MSRYYTFVYSIKINVRCRSGYVTKRTFLISSVLIESLPEVECSVIDASIALGLAGSTLYRKIRKNGISKPAFSDMDDCDLTATSEFPRCYGESLRNVLFQKGIKFLFCFCFLTLTLT